MRKLTQLFFAVIFVTASAFTSSSPRIVSKKTASSGGCADVQLGISYNVAFFPGPVYVTVDVTWMVQQGGSAKSILVMVTGNPPIELSVTHTGRQSYYFVVPTGTYFTVTARPYSSPFPEKGKECPFTQLSVDIPT